jgi:hypothetical protein
MHASSRDSVNLDNAGIGKWFSLDDMRHAVRMMLMQSSHKAQAALLPAIKAASYDRPVDRPTIRNGTTTAVPPARTIRARGEHRLLPARCQQVLDSPPRI